VSDHILVLGAGGFLGRSLVRALTARGEKVITFTRRPIDFGIPGVESIVSELTEPEQFAPLLSRSRAIVHLASRSTPGSSAGNVMIEMQWNLQPIFSLLQALQDKPQTHLLYLSSGGCLYAPGADELAMETSEIRPRSYHGAGKIAAESFINAWTSQYGGAATVLRPSNVYGPGQIERPGFGIVPTVFSKIISGEPITVWGDGSAVRDYLYIDDLVALCVATLTKPMATGTLTLNASSGMGVSLNELFNAIETATGQSLKRTYDASRAVDATRIVMDASLAYRRYGWQPMTPLNEGLRQTWEWFNTTRQ